LHPPIKIVCVDYLHIDNLLHVVEENDDCQWIVSSNKGKGKKDGWRLFFYLGGAAT
jgi:hypothetical protein